MDFFLSAASCYRSEQMINVGVKIFFFFFFAMLWAAEARFRHNTDI